MNLDYFDLNLLRTFVRIFEHGSISVTATRLGLTQPAVSNALARLRRQVGDPLFVRQGRQLVPTEHAKSIYQQIRPAVQLMEQALNNSMGFDPNTAERIFNIALDNFGDALVMPQLIEEFRQYEGIRLNHMSHDIEAAVPALRSGKLHLMLTSYEPKDPTLATEKVFQEEYCLVVSKSSAIDRGYDLSVLKDYDLVGLPTQFASLLPPLAELLKQRDAYRKLYTVNSLWSQAYLAMRGDAVAVMPKHFAEIVAPRFDLKLLELPFDYEPASIYLVWHECFSQDPGHRWLRERIKDILLDQDVPE